MTQSVLLVGATGMFGSRIANYLLDQPDARMRLMIRPSELTHKAAELDALRDRGAEVATWPIVRRSIVRRRAST